MRMRSEPAACSQIIPLGLSKLGELLFVAALWLLPALALAQVSLPSETGPDLADQHVLQVGAFADPANAAQVVKVLEQRGLPSLTRSTTDEDGSALTVVLAGPYGDRNSALSAQAALEADGLAGFVRTEWVSARQSSPVAARQPVQAAASQPAPAPARQPAPVASAQTSAPEPVSGAARISGTDANLAQDQAVLFAQAQQDLFEVPPVVDRPLGMDEGPRIAVSGFALSGAVNREKQDLWVSDLEGILAGHVRSQPTDGYTINQLQAIADELTRHYRERGFIIAQAIVPAQEVRDGTVRLQVLEGSLEDVRVEGNNVYKAAVVERPFRQLRGQPIVQGSIERALLDVQDFPGLTVFGTFTQGDQLGNTDLVVRVREEKRIYVTPSIDNYGSEFTGELRALVDFKINNVFGVADQLNGYVLQTLDPANGTYGGLSIDVPFGRNSFGIGGSTNQFDVSGLAGLTELGVEGTVDQMDLYWNHRFANGRFFSASGRAGLAIKNAVTDIPGSRLNEDNLAVASLGFDVFLASREGRGFSVGTVEIDVGMPDQFGSMDGSGNLDSSGNGQSSRRGGDGDYAGGNFEKAKFSFQHLRRLSTNNSLLLRTDGQISDDLLVALEQYAIGGPQSVRAYPIAQALVDTGISATVEWIINAPGFEDKPVGNRTWGEIFQLSFYADYAYGETNNPIATQEPTVDYSGYGLGLQFNVPDRIFARFDVASPIGDRKASNNRDPQYFFRMSYTF